MGIGGPILLIIFLLEALAGSTMSSPDAPSDPSLLCDEYEQLTLDGPDEPLSLDPPFCVIARRSSGSSGREGSGLTGRTSGMCLARRVADFGVLDRSSPLVVPVYMLAAS